MVVQWIAAAFFGLIEQLCQFLDRRESDPQFRNNWFEVPGLKILAHRIAPNFTCFAPAFLEALGRPLDLGHAGYQVTDRHFVPYSVVANPLSALFGDWFRIIAERGRLAGSLSGDCLPGIFVERLRDGIQGCQGTR